MPRLRVTTIFAVAAVLAITIIIVTSSQNSSGKTQATGVESTVPNVVSKFTGKLPTFDTPSFRFNFRTSSHKPPEQQDSANGETRWYSDWKWLNPFSSSITLDEDRAVLPPLQPRTPVYTYFDPTRERDKETRDLDQQLLQTWRRAWWAYGFRPVILGPAEAQNNPLYESLQLRKLESSLQFEVSRFLAWGHMGSGLLASYHCFPMGAYDDDLLKFLRRGDFPVLTRFDGLGAGLFAGRKDLMNDAAKAVINKEEMTKVSTILEAMPDQKFQVEQPTAIAHYDPSTISAKYPTLAEQITRAPIVGRRDLIAVINSHLHTAWQNTFRKGIVILKPLPKRTTALVEPSVQIADLLAECSDSPLPASCPPNLPKCSPCVSNRIPITTRREFRNTSDEFSIGTVPHPYTLIMLNNQSDYITVPHIRRHTDRDPWLTEMTKDILGSSRGGPSRLIGLKDVVASEYGQNRGLWLSVDQLPASASQQSPEGEKGAFLPEDFLVDLDYFFGFEIPRSRMSKGQSTTPVPGPERRPKSEPGLPAPIKHSWDVDPPNNKELAVEISLLQVARKTINSKDQRINQLKGVAEMWNLADTEAWRFIKAWRARSVFERLKWEEEEKGYGGTTGAAKGSTRWFG